MVRSTARQCQQSSRWRTGHRFGLDVHPPNSEGV